MIKKLIYLFGVKFLILNTIIVLTSLLFISDMLFSQQTIYGDVVIMEKHHRIGIFTESFMLNIKNKKGDIVLINCSPNIYYDKNVGDKIKVYSDTGLITCINYSVVVK